VATNTYVALDTQTLSSAVPSVTFSSINQGYTDLVMVINTTGISASGSAYAAQFNGDTTSGPGNYSARCVTGTGASAISDYTENTDNIQVGAGGVGSGTGYETLVINFPNYSNTTTYKTALARWSAAAVGTSAQVGTWRSTAAINSIKIYLNNVKTFSIGSTFTLYGIANSDIGAPKAFGGIITQDATYTYHTFGASGTFTPQQSLTCDYLVVAGGGSGAKLRGAGGGAGGLRTSIGTISGGGGSLESTLSLSASDYTITVGAGGAEKTSDLTNGNNGNNSSIAGSGITTVTSTGGGGGATYSIGTGSAGGSGGGATFDSSGVGGAGTANQGFAGGLGAGAANYGAGGGGGAGVAGTNGTTTVGGNGGNGVLITALSATGTGVSNYYAGGGGGATYSGGTPGTGGSGGGGAGVATTTAGGAGITNSGGGGGGGGYSGGVGGNGGAGGSGIVIIRYAN
jgi:hypothetical protein